MQLTWQSSYVRSASLLHLCFFSTPMVSNCHVFKKTVPPITVVWIQLHQSLHTYVSSGNFICNNYKHYTQSIQINRAYTNILSHCTTCEGQHPIYLINLPNNTCQCCTHLHISIVLSFFLFGPHLCVKIQEHNDRRVSCGCLYRHTNQ